MCQCSLVNKISHGDTVSILPQCLKGSVITFQHDKKYVSKKANNLKRKERVQILLYLIQPRCESQFDPNNYINIYT